MGPDAAERLRVYQEGQRSARSEDAECPYRHSDWRSGTWLKGRSAAMQHHIALQAAVGESASIKVAEERHKKPLSATDIEIAIGYRLPQHSMELLLRLMQERDALLDGLRKALPHVVSSHEPVGTELDEMDAAVKAAVETDAAIQEALAQPVQESVPQRWVDAAQVVLNQVDALPHEMRRYVTGAGMLRSLIEGDETVLETSAERTLKTEADSAPAKKERVASHGLSPEVRLVLTQSRQALLGALGCYPLEHDKRPGAAHARPVLQEIDRLLKEPVDRDPIAPALTPEPVSVRLTLKTAEGRAGQETLGSGAPMTWDRDDDDETVTATFELLQKTTDGRDVVCGGYEIDGDAWRVLESQGDPELVLQAVRNDVPLEQAVTAAIEAARRSQQQPRER